MATDTLMAAPPERKAAVAAWWHTGIVLLILAAESAAGAHFHGMTRTQDGHKRLLNYVAALVMEWVVVFIIWLGVRGRGLGLRDLLGRRWQGATSVLRDLGFAVLFLLVATPCLTLLSRLLHAHFDAGVILPKTPLQLVLWILLAASAGFCEELTFRGYFDRQISAWSGSAIVGLVVQGLFFGMAHGYQGWRMMLVIAFFGWMFGALALWRRSLLPGMVAHGLQDSLAGILGFFAHH